MRKKIAKRICSICKAEQNLELFINPKIEVKNCKGFVCEECKPFRQRNYMLKRLYNIDLFTFNLLLKEQDNKCKSCKKLFTCEDRLSSPQLDHNHTTGKIRGILCQNCNSTLGHAKDDIELLQNLIEYLKENIS